MQYEFEFPSEPRKRPKFPERLFYSVFPDMETAIRVGEFAKQFMREKRIRGKRLSDERLHVSLRHIGDYRRLRSKFVYAAVQAGNAIVSDSFDISFHAMTSFESPPLAAGETRWRPTVLLGESVALRRLHRDLGDAMEEFGLKVARSFTPHMTMFYGHPMLPVREIEPFGITVNEFALVHSKRGLSEYEVLERWPLNGKITLH